MKLELRFAVEDQNKCQTRNFGNNVSVLEPLNLKVLEYYVALISKIVGLA